jgi:hypothetical protein
MEPLNRLHMRLHFLFCLVLLYFLHSLRHFIVPSVCVSCFLLLVLKHVHVVRKSSLLLALSDRRQLLHALLVLLFQLLCVLQNLNLSDTFSLLPLTQPSYFVFIDLCLELCRCLLALYKRLSGFELVNSFSFFDFLLRCYLASKYAIVGSFKVFFLVFRDVSQVLQLA